MRLAHPGLAAVVDVAPAAAAELVPGPRTEASRRSGIGAAATDRGVEPDVLPTAGVRLADRTRTFTPPAPGDLSTPSKSRGHASPKTTKLYDRTVDTVTVDEIPLGNGILTIVQKCSKNSSGAPNATPGSSACPSVSTRAWVYPCVLTPDEGGGFVVSFPDVPGANTCGDDRAEALEMAEDALAVALAGHVHERWDIPVPSPAAPGQILVAVPPLVAAKLALYSAMREQGMTKTALAKRLGLSESVVRRLLNPDHRSHISQLERALRVVGRRLAVEDRVA